MTTQKAPVTAGMFFDLKLLSHFLEDNSSGKLITRARKIVSEEVLTDVKTSKD